MKTYSVMMTLIALFLSGEHLDARTGPGKKMLVAYYSHSGNTRAVAERIARATGADLLEIEPETPYPQEYRRVTEQARREIAEGFRPAIRHDSAKVAGYDVVFVGSPCWWSTVAPPVATFLAGHDFTGKVVAPFMTHEGSRMGRSEEDIRALCAGARVTEGLPVRGGSAHDAGAAVEQWLKKIGLK